MNGTIWSTIGVVAAAIISAIALLRGGKVADKRTAANTAFSQLKEVVDRLDGEVKDLHKEVSNLRIRDLAWMNRDRKLTRQILDLGGSVDALPEELRQ